MTTFYLFHLDVEEYLRPFVPKKWIGSMEDVFKGYRMWDVWARSCPDPHRFVTDLVEEVQDRLPEGMKPRYLKWSLLAAYQAPRGM